MKVLKGKLPAWAILSAIGISGLLLVVIPHLVPAVHGHRALTEGLGVALITAFILGITIDRWMKAEIARDVFNAALGYMMPEEFRREINRIIGFRLLCIKHEQSVVLQQIDGTECVRVTCTIERTIENITTDSQPINNMSHIDEWGFACERSRIEICEVQCPDETILHGKSVQAQPSRIKMETETFMLRPKQRAILRTKLVEIRRNNDHMMMAFTVPTRNPALTIVAPETLHCQSGFGSSDPVESAYFQPRHVLQGTYFPGIHMRVRWHPKEQGAL